ncbi:MAG: hypothetical protein SVM80_07105 [Halobacteriota archaeon]|nr:hypothetical protein [Halobacteriota archaeon]
MGLWVDEYWRGIIIGSIKGYVGGTKSPISPAEGVRKRLLGGDPL